MEIESFFPWIEVFAHIATPATLAFGIYQYFRSVELKRFEFVQSIYSRLNDPALAFDALWEAAKENKLDLGQSAFMSTLITVLSEADLIAEAHKKRLVTDKEVLAVAYEFEVLAKNSVVEQFIRIEWAKAEKLGLPKDAYPFTGLGKIQSCWGGKPALVPPS